MCLDALLVERNVSKAAARVYLSQSAMSCALGKLREHFNDDILVQVGRSMVPTPFALSLAEPVKDVLNQIQLISMMKAGFDPATSDRTISIAITDYDVRVHMMQVIQNVWPKAPKMTFNLRPFTANFQQELDRGEIDILIVADFVSSDAHPSDFLFEDTYSCIVWAENSMVGERLSLKKYLGMGHVTTKWGKDEYTTYDEQLLVQSGYSRRIEVFAPSLITVPLFVVNTDRIATITTRLAHLMAKQWPLKILRCPVDIPPIVEVLQWQKSLDNDPAITWFRQEVKAVAEDLDRYSQPNAKRKTDTRKKRDVAIQ